MRVNVVNGFSAVSEIQAFHVPPRLRESALDWQKALAAETEPNEPLGSGFAVTNTLLLSQSETHAGRSACCASWGAASAIVGASEPSTLASASGGLPESTTSTASVSCRPPS